MIRSLFNRKNPGVSKEATDGPCYVSKKSRREWTQAAIERDNQRRKKERERRGVGSTPETKLGPLNMEVQEG